MTLSVRSGGQTGADLGAIIAAHSLGFPTGGMMPLGFLNQDGNHPEYAELYGMEEHTSEKYPPRTFINVKESDATIRIASDFNSPGEKLTLKAILQYQKPYFDIPVFNTEEYSIPSEYSPAIVAEWIIKHKVEVLNVAGNAERRSPGIQAYTIRYITALLNSLKVYIG